MLRAILDRVEELSGSRPRSALDIGCGTGDTLAKLKDVGIDDVTGVDCSDIAVKEAAKRIGSRNVICCDLNESELPGIGRVFDLIICKLTIAFIQDQERMLHSVTDRMNTESVFCVITPVLHDGVEYTKEDKPGIAVKYAEFRDLLDCTFGHVEDFHYDYVGERGNIVTFLAKKSI